MSLGTNDAVGGALDVEARVKAIVAAADAQGIQAFTGSARRALSSPGRCYSKKLDEILESELAGTSVTMSAFRIPLSATLPSTRGMVCTFSMAGYARLWHKAADGVSGHPVEVALGERVECRVAFGGHKATSED